MPNRLNKIAVCIYTIITVIYVLYKISNTDFLHALYGLISVSGYFIMNYLFMKFYRNNTYLFLSNLFIFTAGFLGLVLRFYDQFKSYDLIMHFYAGILFSIYGFIIFNKLKKRGVKIHRPFLIYILIFSFATTVMLLWEIGEFFLDVCFGSNHMNSKATGVGDTMTDLIVGMIGSIFAIGYKHLRAK